MKPEIFIRATADGETKTAAFGLEKVDEKINASFYLESEFVGTLEMSTEDFNNFCLDLFSRQKELSK